MRAWLWSLLVLVGCGGSTDPAWPKRVTLVTELGANEHDGVRLEDGALVEDGGDLSLYQGKVLAIASPAPGCLCAKGTFGALEDVSATADGCPASSTGTWEENVFLWGSSAIGLGILVRDAEHAALYRLRIAGDTYDASSGVSTATFDYEPVR